MRRTSSLPQRVKAGLSRECDVVRRNVSLPRAIFFTVLVGFVVYFTHLPMRKLAWYYHKPLNHYWPTEYRTNAKNLAVEMPTGEKLSLDDFLKNHGVKSNIAAVSISKDDFVSQCDGCISEPLRLADVMLDITPDWSQEKSVVILSDVVQGILMLFALITMGVLPLMQKVARVSVVSMVTRVLRIALSLHCNYPTPCFSVHESTRTSKSLSTQDCRRRRW